MSFRKLKDESSRRSRDSAAFVLEVNDRPVASKLVEQKGAHAKDVDGNAACKDGDALSLGRGECSLCGKIRDTTIL